VHMTVFHGYHRVTFGYPGAKPFDGWVKGVPNLVRATEGPLMLLGPQATSILGYDPDIHSAVAFQQIGHGLMLLIGPDPQGGKVYYSLDRPKLETGKEHGTDRLLANAVAFLLDPHCNLVPNSGFESNMDLPAEQSNWLITLGGGARKELGSEAAPEGKAFLKLICPTRTSTATVKPTHPIVVERGARYEFRLSYRATAAWKLELRRLAGRPGSLKHRPAPPVSIPASTHWRRFTTELVIPSDVSYLQSILTLRGPGELCLDAITLHLR